MNDFIFSLNSTIPIFLVMVFGWWLMQKGLFTKEFTTVADRYVFSVGIPFMLFHDIATADIREMFDVRFVIFCMVVTTIMFMGVWGLTNILMKDKSMVGAFSQAAVRGSGAILGIAFVNNIFGNSGMSPLMIVAAIPLYNIYSVIILTFGSRDMDKSGGHMIKTAFVNVCKNPMIISIVLGMIFSMCRIPLFTIPSKFIASVGATATPIALLMIGAEFEGSKAIKKIKPTVIATLIKLVILPLLIVPVGVALGFRDSAIVSILIVSGSPTTVACYIMAKNMGNDEVLTSSIVVATTVLSSITLTAWIFVLRSIGVI